MRPLSELAVAERFARTSRYDDVFSSCNRNFRILGPKPADRWCGQCPKCHFVFLALAPFMSRLPLDAFDVQVWNYYQFPHNREEIHGSLGWVKTFGNLVVVQLNNYASYTTTASGFSASRGLEEVVNVTASLGWLEQQLHRARMQGKAVVVMKHAPTIEPLFDDIIDKYNVSAVFVGHHHESLGATREPVGRSRTPSFYSGGASQRSYLVLENVDNADTELRVHAVRGNNPEAKTYAGSIPLKRHVQYAVPNDYPVEVRVHNQGAYEGGYWLTYSLGNRKHTASRYLHMSQTVQKIDRINSLLLNCLTHGTAFRARPGR